ncbi:hypothetical protein A1O3_09770 [Capronia epimyces CBS 606.96]|uniref:Transcription factor domain-containing protein n=1 Tax=Capronia epimyces CBS 606.96 TaxID=1182542 RepID=W9XBF3_9EURO|nr:uncharacterized protein A1O3_09770 [Capronia epimyces CBS 606.96]EXJ77543.1 hypothetical protein A1O3_09770 [Capronia epimyces CBS 606.96]
MAEAVIYPVQPLFMVDRSWQRRKKREKKGPDSRFGSDGRQPLCRVPDVTITLADGPAGARVPSVLDRARSQDVSTEVQFVIYEPPRAETRPQQNRHEKWSQDVGSNTKCRRKKRENGRAAPVSNDQEQTGTLPPLPTLQQPVHGTASPLYTVIDPIASAFQDFVGYYSTRLAIAIFPISKYIPFQYNPVQTVWLPAALTDEVLLHTILYSSALHHAATSQYVNFRDSEVLMKVILNRLNRRLSAGTLSAVTIGAVSCLALCENQLGSHGKWAMHTSGMSEMIRVGGGISSIPDAMRMKIYRADIIGAVDTLSQPSLHRPARTSFPLYKVMELDVQLNEALYSMLVEIGMMPTLLSAIMTLSCLCQALEQAAEKQIPLDPKTYDEDIVCIQYDLLMSRSSTEDGVNESCTLAALIFVQTLTRESPFSKASSTLVSKRLRSCLTKTDPNTIPDTLLFWILFMGGLVSEATEDKAWYLSKLGQHQTSHGEPATWKDAQRDLKKIMWIERIQEQYGTKLWCQIHPSASLSHD